MLKPLYQTKYKTVQNPDGTTFQQEDGVYYDYRSAVHTLRNRPDNQFKTRYLTRGNTFSGFIDNTNSEKQQFVSAIVDYNNGEVASAEDVAGFFEYHISKIASEETIEATREVIVYEEQTTTDADGNEIIEIVPVSTQEPVLDENGNPVRYPIFTDNYVGTIIEMINYDETNIFVFGIDLYNLLEHCFYVPISLEVYNKLNPAEQDESPDDDWSSILTPQSEPSIQINEEPIDLPCLSKVEWLVFWDNPAMKYYDVLVQQMGGRIEVSDQPGALKKYVIEKDAFDEIAYRGNKS